MDSHAEPANMYATHISVYENRARNKALPLWLRMANYCYAGRNPYSDDCPVARGELERELGTTSREIRRARNDAIRYGHLSPKSDHRCLVAPEGAFWHGERIPVHIPQ